MDGTRFDGFTRSLAATASRRSILAALAVGSVGWGFHAPVSARKRKRNKPNFNAFGCLNVGQRCRGNDNLCCSGRCQGKKPRKGKKDTSRCVGHDAGTLLSGEGGCQAGQTGVCTAGGVVVSCTSTANAVGACETTTGGAAFCFGSFKCDSPCAKDADCQEAFGAQAACIVCTSCANGTACASPEIL